MSETSYVDALGDRVLPWGNIRTVREVELVVYGEPVPKQRPRVVNGHAFTPKETKAHESKIASVYKDKYGELKYEKGVPLRVEIDFYLATPRSVSKKKFNAMTSGAIRPTKRPDVDNLAKCVLDACNDVAWSDDSQIVEILIRKFWAYEPKTRIYVTEMWEGDGW